ncbi:MAG: orotate phosphoribosyltransferase [Synechococcales cyanobacterium]
MHGSEAVVFVLADDVTQLAPDQQRRALITLLKKLSYRQGEFTLSSGRTSSHYLNGKPVALHPQGAWLIGQILLAHLPPETEAVAGMTLGADPLVTAVSLASVTAVPPLPRMLPALIVRKQAKDHGTQAWLEGMPLDPGSRVWILEDVVTTGASALKAAERVSAAGYTVGGVLTLVDRQEGGAETYAHAGIPFRAVLTLAEISEFVE